MEDGAPIPAAAEPAASSGGPPGVPDPDRPLSGRGWIAVAAVVLAVSLPLLHYLVRGQASATVAGPGYRDDFQRASIGPDWFTAGGHWQIVNGELWSTRVKNNPLWLRMRLPRDVAIEFDARSETATGPRAGDIKFEVFGDGRDHASATSASSAAGATRSRSSPASTSTASTAASGATPGWSPAAPTTCGSSGPGTSCHEAHPAVAPR